MKLVKSYRTQRKRIHNWSPSELQAVSSIWKSNFIRMNRNGICKRIRYWFHTNTRQQQIPTNNAILAKIAICATAAAKAKL
jgi:hypothetical protein